MNKKFAGVLLAAGAAITVLSSVWYMLAPPDYAALAKASIAAEPAPDQRRSAEGRQNFRLQHIFSAAHPAERRAEISLNNEDKQIVGLNQELAPGVAVHEISDEYVLLRTHDGYQRLVLPVAVVAEGGQGAAAETLASGARVLVGNPPPAAPAAGLQPQVSRSVALPGDSGAIPGAVGGALENARGR